MKTSHGLGTFGSRNEPVVYRWADGSEVLLTFVGSWSDAENQNILAFRFKMDWSDPNAPSVELEIHSGKYPALYVPKYFMHIIELVDQKKLRGFVLDLGVNRLLVYFTGLIATHTGSRPSVVSYPRFFSKEIWDARYEHALDHVVSDFSEQTWHRKSSETVFHVNFLKFRRPRANDESAFWRQTTWTYQWYSNGTKIEREAASLEEAVDDILQTENILPESAKEAWDKENVERGTFVLPTPEEFEIFRILDEPLPFFLPWREVEAWMQASGIWP
jgi:hypothetical protein